MRQVDIIGVGMIPFGKHLDKGLVQMGAMAANAAIKDAGVNPSEINVGFFANMQAPSITNEFTVGQNILYEAGVTHIPIFNIENACTSGSSAFMLAKTCIASGQYDIAIVVGAEKLVVPNLGLMMPGATELDVLEGGVVITGFASRANLHMHKYGTTKEQLAMVAVKNRYHASMNPMAMFKQQITVEEVLNSPMMSPPLTKLSCCPNADGAAAVILCGAELSSRYTSKPIHIAASVLATGGYGPKPDFSFFEEDRRASNMAYEQAGVGPEDINLVECHDAFTINEVMHLEALGLCPLGEGGKLVESGATRLGGRMPVNTSGGLLSKGHPLGATAVSQLVEGVIQLRGEAGPRQAEGVKTFLAECMGAEKNGNAKTCTVNILQK